MPVEGKYTLFMVTPDHTCTTYFEYHTPHGMLRQIPPLAVKSHLLVNTLEDFARTGAAERISREKEEVELGG